MALTINESWHLSKFVSNNIFLINSGLSCKIWNLINFWLSADVVFNFGDAAKTALALFPHWYTWIIMLSWIKRATQTSANTFLPSPLQSYRVIIKNLKRTTLNAVISEALSELQHSVKRVVSIKHGHPLSSTYFFS